MPTLTYGVSFSATQALTSGSIRVTDTTDWAGQGIDPADVEIWWGFTAPNGNTYTTPASGNSWNIFPDVQLWQEFPLPQSYDLTVQQGPYTVSVIYSIGGPVDSGDYELDPTTHELCTTSPELCIDTDVNCLNLVVSATDETGWTALGWTVDSRAMTLQYPSSTLHADITGAGPTISTSGQPIWSGTWTATTTVTVTKDSFTTTITTIKQFQVSCDLDGCALVCMLKNKYGDYERAYTNDDTRRMGEIKADLAEMSWLSVMIQGSIGCGDDTFVDTLITKFKKVATGSTTGNCGGCCDDCSEPRQLVPIWGSSGTMWTPVPGGNITITPGVGTYTFAVSQSFVDLVGSLYNTDVDSPDLSVIVTETVAGLLKTKHLSIAKVPQDSMEILWIVDTSVPSFAFSSPTLVGTTFQAPGTVTPFAGAFYSVTNLFAGSATPFDVEVSLESVTLRSPYSNTHRFSNMIDGQIFGVSGTGFTFGVVCDNDVFGIQNGMARDVTVFQPYLTTFTLLFKFTKR